MCTESLQSQDTSNEPLKDRPLRAIGDELVALAMEAYKEGVQEDIITRYDRRHLARVEQIQEVSKPKPKKFERTYRLALPAAKKPAAKKAPAKKAAAKKAAPAAKAPSAKSKPKSKGSSKKAAAVRLREMDY